MDFATAVLGLTMLIIPLVGILTIATPFLMRRGEVFSVTVPDAAARDPYLTSMKRRYALVMSLITVVFTVVGILGAFARNEGVVVVVLVVGTLLICAVSYGLMLFFRAKVRAYKKEQGWQASSQESAALIGDAPLPHAISFKWNLLYVPMLAITLIIGVVGYAHMPDQIPQHIDLQGNVVDYMQKSPLVVMFPVLIVAFVDARMVFSHWTILRSKKPTDPAAPATSALAYGMFARAQSIMLVVGGLLLSLIGPVMELAFAQVINIVQAAIFFVILAMVMVIGCAAVSFIYGQSGSRLFRHMHGSDRLLADDDKLWKLGVFYYNPQDPSLFLPERFGIGWTMNWARPAVWAIMVAFVALTVGFAVAVMLMVQ